MKILNKKDVKKMREDISRGKDPHAELGGKYVKNIIFGGLDGIITTFAVVAGVIGASLSISIVLILGFANLIADGISMSFGEYLSSRAKEEYQKKQRKKEEWEIRNYPKKEKEETVEYYMKHGISRSNAIKIVNIISKKKSLWASDMMVTELGIVEKEYDPEKTALTTFISFVCFGFIPLFTFVLIYFVPQLSVNTFEISMIMTALALFGLGAAKTKFTGRNWVASGIEMLLIGGIAAVSAYGIGYYISNVV